MNVALTAILYDQLCHALLFLCIKIFLIYQIQGVDFYIDHREHSNIISRPERGGKISPMCDKGVRQGGGSARCVIKRLSRYI